MDTEIIKIHPGEGPVSEEDDRKLQAAGEILKRGGLVRSPQRPCMVWAEMR